MTDDAPVFRSTYRASADAEQEQPARSRALPVAILVVLIVIALAVGFLGSLATQEHVDGWYESADKPAWTPPGVVFGPVWSVLYVTMAVAAWLVWRRRDEANVRPALTGYVIQLAINSIWSPVFFALYPTFGVGALWWAFGIIFVLIVAVVYTLVAFWRVERWAGILLIPYLAWLLYASTLNAGVAVLQS
ncbi:TspO/MBR family protein [Salinibacterium sp. ZJ77]|uniref:TspO/MBR family protein n=1 Tax=Salinibacterium sp. ZJ77 TaxID=2708337 RepID=UPI001421AFBB|nr:TspO/MBR family protein [Salinibacterium sp. ZJ77]